jgi:hypothetical protein
MILKKHIALTALALAAGVSTAFAQTNVWSDNFDDNNPIGWTHGTHGRIDETNQQFAVSASFGAAQTNSPLDTHDAGDQVQIRFQTTRRWNCAPIWSAPIKTTPGLASTSSGRPGAKAMPSSRIRTRLRW